ncbi:Plasmodium yoelii subtelomeric region (PYST-C1), putative [Plasmodium chabaudi chabaudi]|uniref:Plasmodium yoelii subtelomeric region (PYST-C1), putative n=1 Tax=Plasmodium chabaudi chabaudi TaxID=31271 RepID=A0A1D3L9P8_PLACU|nr:Plasmodium yoelii subtelomeric region (PYST-C1), putative [Plasmodium chabaudi chabaudi]
MNKRIFSLVCIILYVILAVSIHCSEEKESGLRNRVIRVIKQIKRSNKKNDIASQRETKLNNNNNNNYRRSGDDDADDVIIIAAMKKRSLHAVVFVVINALVKNTNRLSISIFMY